MANHPNRSKNYVVRYVVTHLGDGGVRTLAEPMQGQHTYATEAEAEQALRDFMTNNSDDRLRSVFGLPLEVRPVRCWPGHFDPMTCWFH